MKNFTVFTFHDNDFHAALVKAIAYVEENKEEDLTLDSYGILVGRATAAFQSLHRISNYGATTVRRDSLDYIKENLKVFEADNLEELEAKGNYEGYALNNHTKLIHYIGY